MRNHSDLILKNMHNQLKDILIYMLAQELLAALRTSCIEWDPSLSVLAKDLYISIV